MSGVNITTYLGWLTEYSAATAKYTTALYEDLGGVFAKFVNEQYNACLSKGEVKDPLSYGQVTGKTATLSGVTKDNKPPFNYGKPQGYNSDVNAPEKINLVTANISGFVSEIEAASDKIYAAENKVIQSADKVHKFASTVQKDIDHYGKLSNPTPQQKNFVFICRSWMIIYQEALVLQKSISEPREELNNLLSNTVKLVRNIG